LTSQITWLCLWQQEVKILARPLRIEYAGAVYHITARGNARQAIYLNDEDRAHFLELLGNCCQRHHWLCHAYCLMDNHYHLLIETQSPTLSKGMKYLNGTYTQKFNRQHDRVGHIFQGRFKAILVEKDTYLLELCRYIVLNPVRARMVRSARDWPWSSYRQTAGLVAGHRDWLSTDWLLGNFGKQQKRATDAYRVFVKAGKNQPTPWQQLKNQLYLGSDEFIANAQSRLKKDQSLNDIPNSQKLAPPQSLEYFVKNFSRVEGMAKAYLSGHYTQAEVGHAFGVSYATVSRAARNWEQGG